QECPEALAPDLSLAERGVAVPVGAALVARVVHMEQLELLQADLGVDFIDEVPHPLARGDVIAACVQMAGVDAEAEPLGGAGLLDQLSGLVEVAAEELRRPGGVLVDDPAAIAARERLLDQADRPLARVGPGVVLERAGMDDHAEGADLVADAEGMRQGLEGL